MSNQHYFDIPFGFAGDVTAIPDPLQTGGSVSMTEGWNYNYQRNLSTDPAALPIDRSTMNWLFLQITTAIQAWQKETVPEWITAAQNGGVSLPYGQGAVVLYSSAGTAPFTKYVSLINANTDTPGATANWQVVVDAIATSAQASAGTNNATIMTPALVAQQTALRALLAGSATQVFNVGPATAATHALEAGQIGAAGGVQGTVPINTSGTLNGAVNPNLTFNGSGELGAVGWTLASLFAPANDTTGGTGTYFTNSSALSGYTGTNQSPIVPVGASINVVSAIDIANLATAGTVVLNLAAYTSAGVLISNVATLTIANGSGTARYTVSGTTPATTAYVRTNIVCTSVTASTVLFKRLKTETGTAATVYSQNASVAAALAGMTTIGVMLNGAMTLTAASATATWSADEITVGTLLGGQKFTLGAFSQTINLATTGAGGMDTGTAPVGGFVALYAIYNPSTNTRALLATNATAAKQPQVYGGANMPTGYTASALVSIWPTNASGLLATAYQVGRKVSVGNINVVSQTNPGPASLVSITPALPFNAVSIDGGLSITANATGAYAIFVYAINASVGGAATGTSANGSLGGSSSTFSNLRTPTPRQMYYTLTSSTGGNITAATFYVTAYEF